LTEQTLVNCALYIDDAQAFDNDPGNARLAGFEKDLGLKGYDYNTVLSIFYISYILFEIPATVCCKLMGKVYTPLNHPLPLTHLKDLAGFCPSQRSASVLLR
jgi:hypothetical protein